MNVSVLTSEDHDLQAVIKHASASKPTGFVKYGIAEDELSKTATIGIAPSETISEDDEDEHGK